MDDILMRLSEGIFYAIPALLVLACTYFLVNKFLSEEKEKRFFELKMKNTTHALPLRLQAYERLSLFLERIQPQSMLLRASQSGEISVAGLRTVLIQMIQQEFEHNLTQQIYVSNALWDRIRFIKDNLIVEITELATELDQNAPGHLLLQRIMEDVSDEDNDESTSAEISQCLEMLGDEVKGQL